MDDRSVAGVHAHPDDGSSMTGATMISERGPGLGPHSWEDDLFAGLEDSA
jgi:hypothetical protein